MINLTLFLIALFAALVFVFKSYVKVEDNEKAVVERFGRFHRMLEPGIHLIAPFFEKLRGIEDPKRRYSLTNKISLSPQTMPFPKDDRTFFTKNNEQLKIRCQILYRITDPYKAVYEVAYLFDALNQLIASILQKRLIEKDCASHDVDNLVKIFNDILDTGNDYCTKWGVKIMEFQLKQVIDSNGIRHNIEE